MSPENSSIGDDFDPSAIHRRAFQDYLKRSPEDAQKLYAIGDSLFLQVKKMGLPTNQDCHDFIQEVLDYTYAKGKTREEKDLFRYLTQQDEYGEVASPEKRKKNKQMIQEIAEARENGDIPEFLQKAFARQAVKDLKNGSHGLTPAALREMNGFFTKNHVKAYAEVITNAAAETLLNEPVMQDINDMMELVCEADPEFVNDAGTRYTALVRDINYWASKEVLHHVEKLFKKENNMVRTIVSPAMIAYMKDILDNSGEPSIK